MLSEADHGIWSRVMRQPDAPARDEIEYLYAAATGEPPEWGSWLIEEAQTKSAELAASDPDMAARYDRIARGVPGYTRWVPFDDAAAGLGLTEAELSLWLRLGVVRDHDHSDKVHPGIARVEVLRLRGLALREADLAAERA